VKRGGPLKRTTPLRSTGTSREGKPKAKRPTGDGPSQSKLERDAKKATRRRSGDQCEIRSPWCLGPSAPTEFSHRRADGQGGQWAASNGLRGCGHGNLNGCHGYCHQHPEEARENGWFVSAFSRVWPSEVPAYIWHEGDRAMFLLDDEGGAVPAPFPQGDPRHPDDIPVPHVDHPSHVDDVA
jgi:hypothetical protein